MNVDIATWVRLLKNAIPTGNSSSSFTPTRARFRVVPPLVRPAAVAFTQRCEIKWAD